MPSHLFCGIEVERPLGVGLAGQRRNGVDAPEIFQIDSVASHLQQPSF